VGRPRALPAWQPDRDLDDSVLLWRAVVRQGLTRRRSLFHRLAGGYGLNGLLGGLGAGTGSRLFVGPAADALARAQQAAIRDSSPRQDASRRRTAALEFAALALLDRFDPAERTRLRESGNLPGWFPAELEAKAKEIRKRRGRAAY
jgi:hypothetical protein